MGVNKTFSSGQNTVGDIWYVDNYVLLKEYYDMTISRIAARCVRKGNIAMEEYEHYSYILDVLEEISETGDYIITHSDLHEYVERKIPGGINLSPCNLIIKIVIQRSGGFHRNASAFSRVRPATA